MMANNNSTPEENKDSCKNEYYYSTTEALTGELFSRLCYVKENYRSETGKEVIIPRYYLRAWICLGLIYVENPVPYFIINLSDLPVELVKELEDDLRDGECIFSQAVRGIFEKVTPKDYHPWKMKDIIWRLEP